MPNTLTRKVKGKEVVLRQETGYPWNGDVNIIIDKNAAKEFSLKLRIPGWVRGEVTPGGLYKYADGKSLSYKVLVNGEEVSSDLDKGYFTITRKWKKGDEVSLHLDMEPRIVTAREEVKADKGMIAVERGPIVYCAERPDNEFVVSGFLLGEKPDMKVVDGDVIGHPVKKITLEGKYFTHGPKKGEMIIRDVTATLIPYYAWCHRGAGYMSVWLAKDFDAVEVAPCEILI